MRILTRLFPIRALVMPYMTYLLTLIMVAAGVTPRVGWWADRPAALARRSATA